MATHGRPVKVMPGQRTPLNDELVTTINHRGDIQSPGLSRYMARQKDKSDRGETGESTFHKPMRVEGCVISTMTRQHTKSTGGYQDIPRFLPEPEGGLYAGRCVRRCGPTERTAQTESGEQHGDPIG